MLPPQGGDTPFLIAAFKGHVGVVQVLLEEGANFEDSDVVGDAEPCQSACETTFTVVVRCFVAGRELSALFDCLQRTFGRGRTAHQCASQFGDV